MPNWCHDKLTVEGPRADVEAFRMRVATDEQPLSFAQHVPEPSADVYAAMEEASLITCYLCGGSGVRPINADEAVSQGAIWEDGWEKFDFLQSASQLAVDDRPRCNACSGRGKRTEHEAWYGWRLAHWGTKWDASFDEPFIALGLDTADVEATVSGHGRYASPSVTVYDFTTAWSPPTLWLASASREHPTLTMTLRYGEPGGGYAGEVVAVNGEVVSDKELPIEEVLGPEEMWF